jgi:CheY-like chemotaxis protein
MLQEAFLNAPIECRSKEWTVADLTYANDSENSTTSLIPESPFRAPALREFDSFAERAESGETPIASPSAFRVLYADDDAVNRRLFSRLAAKLRVHCDVVDDGDRVMPAIEARGQALGLPNYTEATVCPYPILFLDIVMTRMDGITTCGEVRRRYGGSVRIVAATGNAHEVSVLLERGFDHVLTKPFTLSEIEEQIKLCHDAIQVGGSSGSIVVAASPAAGSGLLIQPLHQPRRLVARGTP